MIRILFFIFSMFVSMAVANADDTQIPLDPPIVPEILPEPNIFTTTVEERAIYCTKLIANIRDKTMVLPGLTNETLRAVYIEQLTGENASYNRICRKLYVK